MYACMYVCMYVHVCVCMYVCMYVCMMPGAHVFNKPAAGTHVIHTRILELCERIPTLLKYIIHTHVPEFDKGILTRHSHTYTRTLQARANKSFKHTIHTRTLEYTNPSFKHVIQAHLQGHANKSSNYAIRKHIFELYKGMPTPETHLIHTLCSNKPYFDCIYPVFNL
jgi:hypothetical protein